MVVPDACYRVPLCVRSVDDTGGEEVMKQEVLRLLRVLACAGPLLVGTVPVLAAQEDEVKSPRRARWL